MKQMTIEEAEDEFNNSDHYLDALQEYIKTQGIDVIEESE